MENTDKKEKKFGQNVSNMKVLKHMWRSVGSQKPLLFSAHILFIITNICNIFVPLYYKDFFDTISLSEDKSALADSLINIIFIIFIFHVVGWISWRIATYMHNKMEAFTMSRLKQNSFDYLIKHSYNFFSNNFTGSLVQKINRFSRSFEALNDTLAFNIFPLFISIISSIVVTSIIAPNISIVILIWVIVFLTFNISYSLWKVKYDNISAEADSKTSGYLSDTITNSNSVMLFNGNKYESDKLKEISNDQGRKSFKSWTLNEISDAVQAGLILIVEYFVFYYTIKSWQVGMASIGTFVLAQTYIIGISHALWGVGRAVRQSYESFANSKEIVEILEMSYEVKDINNAKDLIIDKSQIVFKDVVFCFNETREVIKNLNTTIKSGEKVAVIGPSGAGKTTFVRLIMRLYNLTSGTIFIDDQDISKVTQYSLRNAISLVPQDPVLFHRTLLENIRYGRREASDEEVIEAAKLAHCDDFIETLPLKYNTYVGERGIKLSGGERQRIAIARAILKKAPILILDEATSSLDSHSEALIQDALDNLMKNCTTIVIAHRLSTIKKMDRIIAMKDGKIAEEGTHEELANKDGGLYKKLWDLQVGGFIKEE